MKMKSVQRESSIFFRLSSWGGRRARGGVVLGREANGSGAECACFGLAAVRRPWQKPLAQEPIAEQFALREPIARRAHLSTRLNEIADLCGTVTVSHFNFLNNILTFDC